MPNYFPAWNMFIAFHLHCTALYYTVCDGIDFYNQVEVCHVNVA
jgi:hypothetical protein